MAITGIRGTLNLPYPCLNMREAMYHLHNHTNYSKSGTHVAHGCHGQGLGMWHDSEMSGRAAENMCREQVLIGSGVGYRLTQELLLEFHVRNLRVQLQHPWVTQRLDRRVEVGNIAELQWRYNSDQVWKFQWHSELCMSVWTFENRFEKGQESFLQSRTARVHHPEPFVDCAECSPFDMCVFWL